MNITEPTNVVGILRKKADGHIFFMLTFLESYRKRRGRDVRDILREKIREGNPVTPSRRAEVLAECKKFVTDNGYKIPDYVTEAIVKWIFDDSARIQRHELQKGDGE